LPTSVERINIRWLLPFFEHYNWGCECCTSVIMPYSHSIQHIQQISKWALPNSKLQPRETHSLRLLTSRGQIYKSRWLPWSSTLMGSK
jgi:hypothetical protein